MAGSSRSHGLSLNSKLSSTPTTAVIDSQSTQAGGPRGIAHVSANPADLTFEAGASPVFSCAEQARPEREIGDEECAFWKELRSLNLFVYPLGLRRLRRKGRGRPSVSQRYHNAGSFGEGRIAKLCLESDHHDNATIR